MVDLELVDLDPRSLVESVAGLVAPMSSRQGLELIAYCAPEVPSRLVGDEGRLRQILLNLASNAVKFTDKGEVVITARMSETNPGRVRFQVADTGIGIPDDAQRAHVRLLHPGRRVHHAQVRRQRSRAGDLAQPDRGDGRRHRSGQ